MNWSRLFTLGFVIAGLSACEPHKASELARIGGTPEAEAAEKAASKEAAPANMDAGAQPKASPEAK
jgi:hypothetical protein